jgi:hypothetical protein
MPSCAHGGSASTDPSNTPSSASLPVPVEPLDVGQVLEFGIDAVVSRYIEKNHQDLFPTGLPAGTCEEALDVASGLYLGDPTAWT